MKWDDHVKHLASSCYGVLAALRKIKNFTNYHLRKHLVECLVLSRLDFNDTIFYPITYCLLKRLQRIQFAAASFVFGRYVNNIEVKNNCCLFERLFKVKKNAIFLFGISFLFLEIFTFWYYANEDSDDVMGGSNKTV